MTYAHIENILKKPLVGILSVILGGAIGVQYPDIGKTLEPYGNLFMALLEMSLIPIILCSIASSIAHLFSISGHETSPGIAMLKLFLVAFIVATVSALMFYVLNYNSDFLGSDSIQIKEISTASSFLERTFTDPIVPVTDAGLMHFLQNSIPNNIFKSLSESKMLQIIVFSIILGVATAFSKQEQKEKLQAFYQTTLGIFQKIIMAFVPWLPFAIICLMAASVGKIGIDMLLQMGSFIFKVYGIMLAIFILSTILLGSRSGLGAFAIISAFKEPIVMAFGTRSAIIPIPAILRIFDEQMKIKKSLPKLLIPLGAVLGRFGNICYLAILAIFIAGIYQVDLTVWNMLLIIFLSIIAGISTAGATGILTLGALTIILDPLHLPIGAILPLLIAIDTIIDPMRTLTTVYTNCAATMLVTPLDRKPQAQK